VAGELVLSPGEVAARVVSLSPVSPGWADRLVELARPDPGRVAQTLAGLACVRAGWAFGVPADGQAQWLAEVSAAAAGFG